MIKLSLDVETFSTVPISYGARAYLRGAELLMAAYRFVDASGKSKVYHWDVTVDCRPPNLLMQYLQDPEVLITAYNAPFERAVLREIMGIDLPAERFRCTMVRAYQLGFKGKMHEVGAQMGLPAELIKYHTAGAKLINRFCSPAPKSHKADRYDRHTHPEEWAQFIEYNIQDVIAEEAIDERCDQYLQTPDWNRDLWYLDQKINNKGVPVDVPVIAAARKVRDEAKRRLGEKIIALTGITTAGSGPQLIAWLEQQGVDVPTTWSVPKNEMVPTLGADSLESMLAHDPLEVVGEVLRLKQQISKNSVAKYDSFYRAQVDGRMYGMFQFAGAQRTNRWSGRTGQSQNLPRPSIPDPESIPAILLNEDIDLLEACYGDAMQALSDCLRSVIATPPGKCLTVSDLGSIESRLLGWHSGCKRINDTFAKGLDTYKEFATHLYGIPYDEVTKDQRVFCKAPTLGCGYRLGDVGLVGYAEGMGVNMTEDEAKHAVRTYRETYPEVVQMWYGLERKLLACVQTGQDQIGYGVRLMKYADMLAIILPSGRAIHYHKPKIVNTEMPWSTPEKRVYRDVFTAMGENRFTHQWERQAMHGGWITENIIQASARDIMGTWLLRADTAGFTPVLHAHDELACEESTDRLEELQNLIRQPIPGYPGLLLDASGYVSQRFKKD